MRQACYTLIGKPHWSIGTQGEMLEEDVGEIFWMLKRSGLTLLGQRDVRPGNRMDIGCILTLAFFSFLDNNFLKTSKRFISISISLHYKFAVATSGSHQSVIRFFLDFSCSDSSLTDSPENWEQGNFAKAKSKAHVTHWVPRLKVFTFFSTCWLAVKSDGWIFLKVFSSPPKLETF